MTSRDGLSLYLRDYGDAAAPGTAVLCLAGGARNGKDFHELAARLAASRRVLCVDYRGRGRSDYDADWRHYHPEVYVRDVCDVLTATDAHPVVVVGTSLGGIVAMALAVVRPTAVAGVVLNDVGPEIATSGLRRIAGYIRDNAAQPDWDSAVAQLKRNFGQLAVATHDGWLRLARNTYRECPDGKLRYDFDPNIARVLEASGRSAPDLWPLFGALRRIPALALRGEHSDVLSQATFDRMAREKPDLVRVTVPGIGHAPMLDEPESVAAIDAFLDAL